MTIKRLSPNGTLTIPLGLLCASKEITFVGGPYDHYETFAAENPDAFGVCVRMERSADLKKDVHLPIRDFSVPEFEMQVRHALVDALRAAIRGKKVYIGCMGGWGRTGLFMALLAKVAGVQYPVDFVRSKYTPHAVETAEQQHYVETFDVSGMRWFIIREVWRSWFSLR